MENTKTKLKFTFPKSFFHPFWLAITFVLSRVLYLAFLHPHYYTLGGGEEPYSAMVARELLKGPIFPIFDYLISDYQGGTLVLAALTAPFYLLFGFTSFASKLGTLTFFVGAFILWIKLLNRYFEKQVAQFFALLFIFAPPVFVQFSTAAQGYHSDSIFFTALTLFFLFKITEEKKESIRNFAILGFICGFSFWFAYIYGATLACTVLFLFFHNKKFLIQKSGIIFSVFFLLGFSPWLYFNIPTGFAGLVVYDQMLWDHFGLKYLLAPLSNYKEFVGYHLFAAFGPSFWGFPRHVTVYCGYFFSLFLFLPIFAFLVTRKMRETLKSNPLFLFGFLYSILFALMIQSSDFTDPRYFIPIFPFIFLFTAAGLSHLNPTEKKKNLFPILFFTLFIAASFLGQSSVWSKDWIGRIFTTKGYAYQWIDFNLCGDYQYCLDRYTNVRNKLNEEDLYEFSTELTAHSIWRMMEDKNLDAAVEQAKNAPEGLKTYFSYFLGREIGERHETIDSAIESIDHLKKDLLFYSRVKQGIYDKAADWVKPESFDKLIQTDEVSPAYWRFVGKLTAGNWELKRTPLHLLSIMIAEHLVKIDSDKHAYFLQGVGQFLYQYWYYRTLDPHYDPAVLNRLPESYQSDIAFGAGIQIANHEFLWQIADKKWYRETFTQSLSEEMKQEVQKGRQFVEYFVKGTS